MWWKKVRITCPRFSERWWFSVCSVVNWHYVQQFNICVCESIVSMSWCAFIISLSGKSLASPCNYFLKRQSPTVPLHLIPSSSLILITSNMNHHSLLLWHIIFRKKRTYLLTRSCNMARRLNTFYLNVIWAWGSLHELQLKISNW